jgi:hypothetical protein|tara:strand:+ start:1412 stop:3622 length:2211 start_codon:yes stop_codon:yes gene_type:complete
MNSSINDILIEWAYRVNNGMPNPKSKRDLWILEGVLKDFGWQLAERSVYISNLTEAPEDDDDKIITYTDTKGKQQKIKKSTARSYLSHPDYKNGKDKDKVAAVKAAGLDKEKPEDDSGKLSGTSDFERDKDGDGGHMSPEDPEWTRTAKASKRADIYKKEKEEEAEQDVIRDKVKLNKRLLKMTPEEREKEVGKVSQKERISNLKARTQFDELAKEEEKRIKKLEKFEETLEKGLETADAQEEVLILTTLAFLYEGRENAGVGKNMLGHDDIDLLHKNRKRLEEMYDDAIPEEVEKGVRKVRNRKVSEDTVRASYDSLPEAVKNALKGKGKTGKSGEKLHFLGYVREDGSITSDVNDPNIKKDENGKPVVKRGKVPSNDRGRLVWRMYLEQGGRDAYTGEPLDLESMDLEHVVGFQNKDNGQPTEEDYKNREHEANQVLTSSRANQNKKDKNMKQFFEEDVDKHMDGDKPKSEEYFKKKKEGFEDINRRVTVEEQTALRLQGDVEYKLKGGGTTRDMHDENVEISESGTPEVASSTLGDNVTAEVLGDEIERAEQEIKNIQKQLLSQPDVSEEDKKSIKAISSKIGKKLVNAMGLTRYVQDPSGRRATSISGTDGYFRGFAMTMAGTPVSERQALRQKWEDSIKDSSNSEVLDAGMANEVMTASLIKRGALDDDNLVKYASAYGLSPSGNETKTRAGWKKDDDGNLIIVYKGKEYTPKEYAQVKLDEVNEKLGTNI